MAKQQIQGSFGPQGFSHKSQESEQLMQIRKGLRLSVNHNVIIT